MLLESGGSRFLAATNKPASADDAGEAGRPTLLHARVSVDTCGITFLFLEGGWAAWRSEAAGRPALLELHDSSADMKRSMAS